MLKPVAADGPSIPRLAWVATALAVTLAGAGVAGCVTGIRTLHAPVPRGGELGLESALALSLLAVALAVAGAVRVRFVRFVALAGSAGLALMSFVEYLGAPGPHAATADRMPLATAVALLLLIAAVLLRRGTACQLLAILGGAIGGLVLIGFSYGTRTLTKVSDSSMSVPAAIAVVLLAFAILAGVPNGGYQWVTGGSDAGAVALRKTLPPLILGLPALTFLHLQGEQRFWTDERVAEAAFVTVVVLLMSALLFRVASSLRQLDRQREQARSDLVDLNGRLMTDVRDSYASLRSAQQRIGNLETSQRAVLTVHDDLLQTIYASGLALRTHGVSDDPSMQHVLSSLDEAVTAIRKVVEGLNDNLGSMQ